MSRATTTILDPSNQQAISIASLRRETDNLSEHTKTLKKLNATTEKTLFTTWASFSQCAINIIEIKRGTTSPTDSQILTDILSRAQTTATLFFNKLRDILKKEWPKKIATVATAIQKTKRMEDMRKSGTVHNMCLHFNDTRMKYELLETTFKDIMHSPIYALSSLEIPKDTLEEAFLSKVTILRSKATTDAEKAPPCCCGLFSRRKRVTSMDDDDHLLLIDSEKTLGKKNPFTH